MARVAVQVQTSNGAHQPSTNGGNAPAHPAARHNCPIWAPFTLIEIQPVSAPNGGSACVLPASTPARWNVSATQCCERLTAWLGRVWEPGLPRIAVGVA
jgi:hypothetical protein